MTSPLPICSLSNPEHPLVDGAPRACHRCEAPLCLRKQVVNLALGLTEQMMCLECLARDNAQNARELLEGLQDYIQGRDCFAKQWRRYESVEFCPDKKNCLPDQCFQK
jgi:hypothetical protein